MTAHFWKIWQPLIVSIVEQVISLPTFTSIVYVQEVCTEELQAAGHVTLDKQTLEQLQQSHKGLKVQLQTTTRSVEKKAMLEKQKEQNKGTVEKTASLQVS